MKKTIGLEVKAPKNRCDDSKCVWHGSISVRGKSFNAVVRSTKSHQTAIVESNYTRFLSKYEAYERRKIRLSVHNPDCIKAKEGNRVIVAECRPISKTKSFIVVGFAK